MNTQSYNTFWQRIHKSAKNKGFPLRVMFELTYRCNFFCRHCYVPLSYRERSKEQELKTKDIFSILEQLRVIGCFYLGFTGGEPFIREDIMHILWYAKKLGFEIIIYTNGSLIDEKIAKELANLKPNKVDITIPAMSKDAFESISGVSGSRDKVFDTVELLYRNGVNLGFKTCVLKENESEIEQIQNFSHSLGVQHRLDDMFSPRLDGSKEPYKYRGRLRENKSLRAGKSPFGFAQGKQVTNTSSDNFENCILADSNNFINSTNSNNSKDTINLFECGIGRSQAAITPFGELKMCLEIDYPKYRILDMTLKKAWERLKKLVSKIKPDSNYKCNECEFQIYCHWCPAKSWLQYKNFTSCDSESRRWAESLKTR